MSFQKDSPLFNWKILRIDIRDMWETNNFFFLYGPGVLIQFRSRGSNTSTSSICPAFKALNLPNSNLLAVY